MPEWIKCYSCGLSHTPRPNRVCPKCGGPTSRPATQPNAAPVSRPPPVHPPVMPSIPPAEVPMDAPPPPPRAQSPQSFGFDEALRTDKEKTLFGIGVAFSGIVYLCLLLSIIGAFYAVGIALFVLLGHALHLAHVRGNGLRVSERQFPELYERVKAAAFRLGMEEIPEVYILQSGGVLNAMATKLLSRKYVIIYSSLVDDCLDSRQLDFVVGHEIGHLAAGHLKWNALLIPFMAMPWVGPAYSRAREYTCDRCGFAVAGDLEQSIRGLSVLAAGGKLAATADLQEFQRQREETGGFWMAVYELVASHPYLCKRVAALQDFVYPGTVRPVPRNVFAYILAPVLGIPAAGASGAGGVVMVMMIVVAMMGMMAAIAIPNILKFEQKAKAAAAHGESGDEDSTDAPAPPAWQAPQKGQHGGRR